MQYDASMEILEIIFLKFKIFLRVYVWTKNIEKKIKNIFSTDNVRGVRDKCHVWFYPPFFYLKVFQPSSIL